VFEGFQHFSKRICGVNLNGELLMQLTLELIQDPFSVQLCLDRVMGNECGRIAEIVFEKVKNTKPFDSAVQQAE